MSRISLGFTLAAAFSIAACLPGPDEELHIEELPLDAPAVSHIANERVAEHIEGVSEAVKVLGRSSRLEEAAGGNSEECPPPTDEEPNPPCEPTQNGDWFDISEAGTGVRDWLRNNVFNDEGVESSTETSVTYRLFPETMCPLETDENGIGSRDPQCLKFFTDLPMRMRVTSVAEGDLDVAVTVGDYAVGQFELYASHVSVQADLATVKTAIQAGATILEEDVSLMTHLSGVVKLSLTRHSATDYSADLSIIEALHFAINDPQHAEYVDVKLGAAANAASVRLTSETGLVGAQLAFTNINLAAALDLLAGSGESCEDAEGDEEPVCTTPEAKTGVVSLALAGLTGVGSFNVDDQALSLSGIGVGNEKAVVKLNETELLSAVINPDANGVFDALVASLNDDTQVRFEVSPSLSLSVEHDLAPYIAAMGADAPEVPAWLVSGTTSANTGGAKAVIVYTEGKSAPPCDSGEASTCAEDEEGEIQLIEGSVTLSASDIPDVVITAPQCLVIDEGEGEGEGEGEPHLFTFLSGGECR